MRAVTVSKRHVKIPKHKRGARKGEYGRVLIIGGSEEYVGALVLCGLSALRSGCDWVTIAAPEKVAWAVNTLTPDLVTIKLKGKYFARGHVSAVKKLVDTHDVVLIGNGIGLRKETKEFVRKIVKYIVSVGKKLVVDADGLKCLRLKDVSYAVLTPHGGEYSLLLENSGLGVGCSVEELREELEDVVVVKKGKEDLVISADKVYRNVTGNSRMAVAGTGDVLAGLIVGFLGQGCSLVQASINGVYVNGVLGDSLQKKKGNAYIASDLLCDYRKIVKGVSG